MARDTKERGVSLVEILVVIAIIAVIAAIVFPTLSRSKAKAKQVTCQSQLRQVAIALNLYRNDNDERGYIWSKSQPMRYPWNHFDGIKQYLREGKMVWCTEPDFDGGIVDHTLYKWKHYPDGEGNSQVLRSWAPLPGQVVAWCSNHASGAPLAVADVNWGKSNLRAGRYQIAREDGSAVSVDANSIEVYFAVNNDWTQTPPKPEVGQTIYSYFRFPGETWPPVRE